ncbi:MAG: hypothetical protein QGH34_03320 [Candidatus Woesearchaeota archaeon]|jgi:hypothetical protein|nr:hypothetical protein [Candidatus Woesearchaeota archaeon]|tara:strand:+ start:5081 stop:5917 length:837 start_codon:yes stop_codon:yes gene_type:complete
MINQLQQIFKSITKSLEILYVIEDIKPCARILVYEVELEKITQFLSENNLQVSISDFKVIKQNVQSEFYSDKSIKISKNAPEKGYFFVYTSKNKDTAEKAKLMEANSNHKGLGLALGYPQCCCDFFEKNFSDKNTDLTLKILENSDGFEFQFYNNTAARHFDVTLLSHFPHSFECEPSIEIAKNNLRIMQKYSKQLAEMFASVMSSAVIYSMEEGICLLRKYEKIKDEIIYSDVMSTTKSKLYYLLSSNKKLKIIDKNSFYVNEINIKGPKYGIMIFT